MLRPVLVAASLASPVGASLPSPEPAAHPATRTLAGAALPGDVDSRALPNGLVVTAWSEEDANEPWMALALGGGALREGAGEAGLALLAAAALAPGGIAATATALLTSDGGPQAKLAHLLLPANGTSREPAAQIAALAQMIALPPLEAAKLASTVDALQLQLSGSIPTAFHDALFRSAFAQVALHRAPRIDFAGSFKAATTARVDGWLRGNAVRDLVRVLAVGSGKANVLRGELEKGLGALRLPQAPPPASPPPALPDRVVVDAAELKALRETGRFDAGWDLPQTHVFQWWVVDCKEAKEHVAVALFAELWNDLADDAVDFTTRLENPDQPAYRAETLALSPTAHLLLLHGHVPAGRDAELALATLSEMVDEVIAPRKNGLSLADRFNEHVDKVTRLPQPTADERTFAGGARAFGWNVAHVPPLRLFERELEAGCETKALFAAGRQLRPAALEALAKKQLRTERSGRARIVKSP